MLEEDLQPPQIYLLNKMVRNVVENTCPIVYSNFLAPNGLPQNVTFLLTSRKLTFFWSPPLPSQRNGVIISYSIICSSGDIIINTTRTSITSLTITGLQPFTNYTCSVSASTIIGDGPAAKSSAFTLEESKYINLLIII